MELFKSLLSSRWLVDSHFIVVFTKLDLFIEKLARVPLERYFPNYHGGSDVNKAVHFFMMMFMDASDASCWESFTPVVADLSSEEGMRPFWRTFHNVVSRERGRSGSLTTPTDLFAVTVLICDRYLQPQYHPEQKSALRFFRIASRLPLELQMILCNRAGGSMKNNISGLQAELSIVKVLKFFSS